MSAVEDEVDEFGVAWDETVDETALFSDDDNKLNVVSSMSSEAKVDDDDNEEEDEYEASSVEEDPDDVRRNSWATDPAFNDHDNPAEPPYTPSPAAKINDHEVERLTPGSSRLATFRSDLKFRFSDTSDSANTTNTTTRISDLTDYNHVVTRNSSGTAKLEDDDDDDDIDENHNEEGKELDENDEENEEAEEDDEEDAFQQTTWPGDTDEDNGNNNNDDDYNNDDENADVDDDTDHEQEGGDFFAVEEQPNVIPTNHHHHDTSQHSSVLSKELSTTWMKFDDDKWDTSKHSEPGYQFEDGKDPSQHSSSVAEQMMHQHQVQKPLQQQEQEQEEEEEEEEERPTPKPVASSTPTKSKKKKNGKFSLEAGLAKVSKDTQETSNAPPEEVDGEQREEIISFWGEGSEEEASANDPLAIALKSKPSGGNDSSIFKSPMSHLSEHHSSKSSSLGLKSGGGGGPPPQHQHQLGTGWIQKGLGTALGKIASNLPFVNKSRDEEDDEGVEEDNVVEPDDNMPFPSYMKIGGGSGTQSNKNSQVLGGRPLGPDGGGSMQDISAMSDDSSFSHRGPLELSSAAVERRAVDLPGAYQKQDENHNKNINGNGDDNDQQDANLFDDPCQAMVKKMIDQKEKGIKFAKEVKEPKMFQSMALYDLVIDVPHPATVDPASNNPIYIGAPTEAEEDIEIQDHIQDSMQDITCLAFPDYDSTCVPENNDDEEEDEPASVLRFQKSPLETPGFQCYTFTLKLASGTVVYAHVRRYLPMHKDIPFRFDVGRRLGRALVIFTRYPGGDDFFQAVLGTLDAISSQHTAMSSVRTTRPQKWFLQNLFQKHHRLCGHYATNFDDRRGAPHIITLQGLEFADCMEHYATVDATHFFVPTNLLHVPLISNTKTSYNCSMLPILRCLGVVNAMRLLSALMSERRIILVSVSPTRLDRSIRAAMSMLAQGMLNWQHMCVPVLPPDLWSCLKSPTPYIIGVLAPMAYRLELTDGLGEVVVFNLDENNITAMGNEKLSNLVPDLCRSLSEAMLYKRRIPVPENVATEKDMASMSILNSTSDFLAQDLVEIVKADKKTMNGTSVAAKHMAKKASKAVKSTLQYFLGGGEKNEEGEVEGAEVKKSKREKRMEPDAVYIEGCRNEGAEEAVQLAFVCFFLRVLGNAGGYVYETEDSSYRFNMDKFLKERVERGDGKGTPMWGVLRNFCETAMVHDFVKVREEQIRQRQPIPPDAPVFWQCIDFLEMKNIDFGIINIRSVSRMLLQKSSVQQMLPSNIRRLTMALTSKRKFEGDVNDAISDLAELSRESTCALNDVMSVIWLRSRDCKGLQWVHGYQAMKVLKVLLLNGPLAGVSEATDGIQRIRTLAFRKSQGSDQIQAEALEIYNLLSDRSRLFLRRRVAGEARRKHYDPDQTPLIRDTRLNLESPFKEMHAAMNPNSRPPEQRRRRASLSSRRASLSSRLPPRLSITKHIMALEPMDDESVQSFTNVLPGSTLARRSNDFLFDTYPRPGGESIGGSVAGDIAHARRFVREVARKTAEEEKNRTREVHRRRDSNAMGVELLKKQFMLLKVAIYLGPIFYIFGNHEHFLTIVMFVWLSQQFQVFRAPIDTGGY